MLSLRCLISALTQAGGGDVLFRFASSVQSCCGEGGVLHTDVAVCGEHSPCSGHTGFAPYRGVCAFPSTLLRLPAALCGAGPALSAVPVFRYSTTARIRLRLRVVSSPPQWFRQPKACARSPGRGVPFPSAASGLGSQRFGRSLSGCGAPFPSAASGQAARGLCGLSLGEACLFPPRPQRAPPIGSLQTGTRACLPGGRGWLLWG